MLTTMPVCHLIAQVYFVRYTLLSVRTRGGGDQKRNKCNSTWVGSDGQHSCRTSILKLEKLYDLEMEQF